MGVETSRMGKSPWLKAHGIKMPHWHWEVFQERQALADRVLTGRREAEPVI